MNQIFIIFSGTSIDSVSENDKVVLRFDTSYEGQFVKSYFIEINKTWNQAVLHHTLPSSIPVSELAKRSDLPKFVSEVRKYLYAVTSRQKEVTILQVKFIIFCLICRIELTKKEGRKCFDLTTHSTHIICGYMVSDIW